MPGESTAVATPPAPAPAAPVVTPPAAPAAITPPPAAPAPAPAAVVTPPPAPAEVKLALPKEGAAIDQARVDELTAFAKANGLSQAAAEKLLERENAGAAQAAKANETALAEAKQAWIGATAAAEDLAGKDGTGLVATKEIATKALTKFGDPDLTALLGATGFGEHPVVLRFLKRIGSALGEDGLPAGGGNLGTKQPKNLADFYKPAT